MAKKKDVTLIVYRECVGDKTLEEVMLPLLLDSLRDQEKDSAHLIPDGPSNTMHIEPINPIDQQGGEDDGQLDSS